MIVDVVGVKSMYLPMCLLVILCVYVSTVMYDGFVLRDEYVT